MKITLLSTLGIAVCAGFGCATGSGPSLRADGSPGPQECPEKALEAMRILRLRPGDSSDVEIDANQSRQQPLTVYEGPVESYLNEDLGYLPPVTRLYGRIWTGGPNVVIRYYEARPPDGETIPICAVARLTYGGLRKKPGSAPGTAVLEFSSTAIYIVDSFR
ncbi:serine/threonine protein kinase [Pyxidicoccus sp. 3LG]